MALRKVFLVALVTAAALWTAAEADEGLLKGPHRPQRVVLQNAVCLRPLDGNWDVTDGLVGSPTYHVDMRSVQNIYTGTGYSTVAYPPFPQVPLTLSAVFDETACTFTGTIALPSTNTVISFVWSVDSDILMTGTGRRFVNGVLESTLRQTAEHA